MWEEKDMQDLGINILLIDDDASSCNILSLAMRRAGFRVQVRRKSECVISLVNQYRPHIVLLDIYLLANNYTELLPEIKDQYGCKIIVLTSFGFEEVVQKAMDLGIDDFIRKPFEVETVIRKIENAILQ